MQVERQAVHALGPGVLEAISDGLAGAGSGAARRFLENLQRSGLRPPADLTPVDGGLCEHLPQPVWRKTFDGRVAYVSRSWRTYTGVSLQDATLAWPETIHPEDWTVRQGLWARAMVAGQPFEQCCRVRRADGVFRWHLTTVAPIADKDGYIAGWAGAATDVDDLKRAEGELRAGKEHFRTLADGAPPLLWRAKDFGAWTSSSRRWREYTGQSEAQCRSLGWLEAVHPEDRRATMAAWVQAGDAGALSVELRIWCEPRHEHRWCQCAALPRRDSAGAVVEWLGAFTDVHELRQALSRRAVLVAESHHRARNVIGLVRAISSRTLRASSDLSDYAARFGDRLEALARAQRVASVQRDQPAFLEQLLRDELAACAPTIVEGQVEILGPETALPAAAAQTLGLALHELTTNAIKYGALSNGGRLIVSWTKEQAGPGPSRLRLEWERLRNRNGYGRELLERALPYELGAETRLELADRELRWIIALPL